MEIKLSKSEKVVSSESVFRVLSEILRSEEELDRDKEHLWALGLSAQNHIKYIDLVHLGSINQCTCCPMEIYRRGCIKGIASLIVAHNHPSGDPKPSQEDKMVTLQLREAGKILKIKLLDHIIIGAESYFSFADEGLINAKGGAITGFFSE